MRTQVEENFSKFYERWLSQLEAYRVELLKVSKESQNEHADQAALVSRLTSHFKEYYTTKWEMAKEDILAFYTPTWLTPLEITHLWVTGWKPSMLFRVLDKLKSTESSTLAGLTEDQIKKIEGLKVKIRVEEDKVEREMERQQVAMADRQMVEMARTAIRARNSSQAAAGNVDGLSEVAVKSLLVSLERLMKAADCVRLKTLKWLLEVLSPAQCVDFLIAEAAGHIQMREWGMKKQSEAAASSASASAAAAHPPDGEV